jgi:hypothetical protein
MGVEVDFTVCSGFLPDLGSLKRGIKMLKCGDLGGESLADEPSE